MEIFPNPAMFHTSENPENTMRKNGVGKTQRKPFLDRPVNSKTPVTDKLSKGGYSLKFQQTNTPKLPLKSQENFDDHEYMCSYKEKEDYECDMWPKTAQLGTKGIIQILHNYCNSDLNTPPLSPMESPIEIKAMFLKLPDNLEYQDNNDHVFFESIDDEVDIPQFDDSIGF